MKALLIVCGLTATLSFGASFACLAQDAERALDTAPAPKSDLEAAERVGSELGKCAVLSGQERARCEEAAREEDASDAVAERQRGTCDALQGPDLQLCLQRGGTVSTGAAVQPGESPSAEPAAPPASTR